MKTIEEKAFDDKIEQVELEELMYDEFYELIAEAKNIGYKKAMRWRDPKEELPEINSRVLLKSETGYVEARTIRNWHISKSMLNVSIGGKKVIGWRPIE